MNILGNAKFISNSSNKTKELGEELGKLLKKGDVVTLIGELGSGKTCFVQGIAKGLEIKEPILSPTFTIISIYQGKFLFYHIDLFRIKSDEELYELGIEDGFENGVCAIEWAEKLGNFTPEHRIEVKFKILGENEREIIIEKL
jgi:tRNA threonylcarbamoyladenosine biosynthesis protein TsaE